MKLAQLDTYFRISERGSSLRLELIAGLTTFLAMVYSVIVVPKMLGAAGFDEGAVFVATCLVSAFGSLLSVCNGRSSTNTSAICKYIH